MNVFEKLQEIFRDIFDDDNLNINREMSAKDIEGWDSLAQINIVVASESEFSVKFDINEVIKLSTIGDMLDLIEEKIKKK